MKSDTFFEKNPKKFFEAVKAAVYRQIPDIKK